MTPSNLSRLYPGIMALVLLLSGGAWSWGSAASSSQAAPTGPIDGSRIFVELAKKVVPSVVNISTTTQLRAQPRFGSPQDLFSNPFGMGGPFGGAFGPGGAGPEMQAPQAMSLGTGFVIDPSGIVMTNNHVVENADTIKIQFTEASDEEPTDGVVIGRDPDLDVALIRVKTKRNLTALALGNSDGVEVGEYVLAVGNPFGQGHSVTHGIISAKGRVAPGIPLTHYLQTDAPINPGNSGGPLLNLKGEVIGINNAIDPRAQSIGFAIPIDSVKAILPQLEKSGKVSRGFLGIGVSELDRTLAARMNIPENARGPVVTQVYQGGPADEAGVHAYDVITSVDDKPIRTGADLVAVVAGSPVGKTVALKVLRAGSEKVFNVRLNERPEPRKVAER